MEASRRSKKTTGSIPSPDTPKSNGSSEKPVDANLVEVSGKKAPKNESGNGEKIFAPDNPSESWIDEMGAKHMSMFDVLQIELMLHKIEALTFQSTALVLQADDTERKAVMKVRHMRAGAKNHDRQRGELEEEYKRLLGHLGEKYEVSFKTWGYDTDDGKLTDLSDPKDEKLTEPTATT